MATDTQVDGIYIMTAYQHTMDVYHMLDSILTVHVNEKILVSTPLFQHRAHPMTWNLVTSRTPDPMSFAGV